MKIRLIISDRSYGAFGAKTLKTSAIEHATRSRTSRDECSKKKSLAYEEVFHQFDIFIR